MRRDRLASDGRRDQQESAEKRQCCSGEEQSDRRLAIPLRHAPSIVTESHAPRWNRRQPSADELFTRLQLDSLRVGIRVKRCARNAYIASATLAPDMLRYRLITGPLLILLVVGVVFLDDYIEAGYSELAAAFPKGSVLFLFSAVLCVLIAREISAFAKDVGIRTSSTLSSLAALIALTSIALSTWQRTAMDASVLLSSGFALIFAMTMLTVGISRETNGAIGLLGATLIAAVYGGAMLGFWLLLRAQHSAWFLAAALLTTKSSDIGAYAVGCTIGRHKLIPWLSPKKSWEGLVGGIATSALVAALFAHFLGAHASSADQLPVWFAAIVGACLGLAGQFGDLCESALKRDAGAKDSGSLLPGMGGVLDVLDSPLLAGPVLWWLLHFAPQVV